MFIQTLKLYGSILHIVLISFQIAPLYFWYIFYKGRNSNFQNLTLLIVPNKAICWNCWKLRRQKQTIKIHPMKFNKCNAIALKMMHWHGDTIDKINRLKSIFLILLILLFKWTDVINNLLQIFHRWTLFNPPFTSSRKLICLTFSNLIA